MRQVPSKAELKAAVVDGEILAFLSKQQLDVIEMAGEVLAKLQDNGEVDVVAHIDAQSWSELDFSLRHRATDLFKGFLAATDASASIIVPLLERMHSAVAGAGEHTVRLGAEQWMRKRPERASDAVRTIVEGTGESPFLGMFIGGWREIDPQAALNKACDLCDDGRSWVTRQAIYSLNGFGEGTAETQHQAAAMLTFLIKKLDAESQIIAIRSALYMLGASNHRSADLVRALEEAVVHPSAEVVHEFVFAFSSNRNSLPEKLQARVFELMKGIGRDDPHTLNLVDSVLYRMDPNADRDLFYDLLTSIIKQGDDAPSLKMFDSAIHRIRESGHRSIGWFAINWLLDGDFLVCSEMHSLFPPLDRSIYDLDLGQFALNDDEVSYLCRKVFGYMSYMHGPAVSLLSACLARLRGTSRAALEEAINDFWLRNYPDDLTLFDQILVNHPWEGLDTSIGRMRERVKDYQSALEKLPRNRALEPSTSERRVQSEIRAEQHREIAKSSREKSIFASILTVSTILYGRASITYTYAGSGEKPVRKAVPFTSHSIKTANPQMDILHPTRLNHLLCNFRNERRPS